MDDVKQDNQEQSDNASEYISTSSAEITIDEVPSTDQAVVDATQQVDFLVRQFLKDIERLRNEIKEQRQMVKDATSTDAAYKEIDDQIKTLTKQRKTIQSDIAQRPGVQENKEQLSVLQEDLKTAEKKFSDYLRQYVEQYDSKTFEDEDGIVRDIVTTYKLVKRPS